MSDTRELKPSYINGDITKPNIYQKINSYNTELLFECDEVYIRGKEKKYTLYPLNEAAKSLSSIDIKIEGNELKQLIRIGKVRVTNLTLTSDNRLIESSKEFKIKKKDVVEDYKRRKNEEETFISDMGKKLDGLYPMIKRDNKGLEDKLRRIANGENISISKRRDNISYTFVEKTKLNNHYYYKIIRTVNNSSELLTETENRIKSILSKGTYKIFGLRLVGDEIVADNSYIILNEKARGKLSRYKLNIIDKINNLNNIELRIGAIKRFKKITKNPSLSGLELLVEEAIQYNGRWLMPLRYNIELATLDEMEYLIYLSIFMSEATSFEQWKYYLNKFIKYKNPVGGDFYSDLTLNLHIVPEMMVALQNRGLEVDKFIKWLYTKDLFYNKSLREVYGL